ncbi:MAG: hypothetical protein MN733_37665, partial [Nitrososphaera sp.]|nr:hypothetical protein [Nitrososphaera sp.]
PIDSFISLLEETGFTGVQVTRNHLARQEKLSDFQQYASQRYRTSQLMAISDEAYQAGLQRIEEALQESPSETHIASQLCFVTVVGEKPS